jgi:hypothetical protein
MPYYSRWDKVKGALRGGRSAAVGGAVLGGFIGSVFGPAGTIIGGKIGAVVCGAGGAAQGYSDPKEAEKMALSVNRYKLTHRT